MTLILHGSALVTVLRWRRIGQPSSEGGLQSTAGLIAVEGIMSFRVLLIAAEVCRGASPRFRAWKLAALRRDQVDLGYCEVHIGSSTAETDDGHLTDDDPKSPAG